MLKRLRHTKPEKELDRLRKKCDHLRSLMDDMISGIMLVDETGSVLFINRMVLRFLERTESECLGQSVDVLFPRMADVIMERVQGVFARRQSKAYEDKVNFTGHPRWLHTVYQPAYDDTDAIYAVQILSLDVTPQRKIQEDLLETQQMLKESQRIAKLGTWSWVVDTGEVTWSDQLYRIYGFEPDEINPPDLIRSMVHPDDLDRWDAELKRALDSGTPFQLDYRILRKDDTFTWIHSRTEAIHYADGRASKVYGVTQDIADRIAAEQQRIVLEKQLRQSQKMEAIGTLAGGIAHDFNNILSSILGFSELVMDDLKQGSVAHGNIKEVIMAGLRAKELVRHLLTFSRQTEREVQPMQVSSIVKEAVRMLRATIPATIDVVVEDVSENSTIMGDATQIHQVVLNLCTNASHAMEDDGGTMIVRLENVSINGSGASFMAETLGGHCLKLSVIDTGTGIAPELIDRITEPYMTTKESGKGTGLGLSVVHGIVKSHNGVLSVESRPGEGTAMEVILPLIEKSECAEETAVYSSLPMGTEHILLVDDELQIVKSQNQMLQRLGYNVSMRTSSIEALEAFIANPDRYDAVITDMTMPHMTGDRLVQHIKALRPGMPIIICSGYSEKLSEEKVAALGIGRFLMKPVSKVELANTLRELLDRSGQDATAGNQGV